MDPKPFTYEHFIQAVQSLKDGMLMYYIDEAVAIYCRLRGGSVGPRPASFKNYSRGYADAFEAANYAIFTVSQKIGSYDSEKGPFRPYLVRALENALKDILKADGHSDFFDQTSKRRFNEDEPERHLRVEADRFWGQAESDSEPDSVSSDRDERIRKHKDEALETMIKFIDSLPGQTITEERRQSSTWLARGRTGVSSTSRFSRQTAHICSRGWSIMPQGIITHNSSKATVMNISGPATASYSSKRNSGTSRLTLRGIIPSHRHSRPTAGRSLRRICYPTVS